MSTVRPVDVEGALVGYLSSHLSVPVATFLDNPRPPSCVRLFRIGGVRRNEVQERALLNIEAWADDEVSALELATNVWSLIDAADGEFVANGAWLADGSTGLASPVSNPDPESKQARYQFTANLTFNLEVS